MIKLTAQEVIELLNQRSSTRYYDSSKKISDEDFNAILECARLSPSSVGSEPWKLLVIQNKALREKIKPFSWGMANQLDDCSHLVVLLAKKNARYDSPFFVDVMTRKGLNEAQQQQALAKYKALQENEMNLLENDRTLFDWCSKQTYIALANMLTGAAALGIDSCPIEGFNYELMNQALAEEGLFDPNEYGVSVAATFGYRSRDITKKSRKSMDEIVTWVE
ncbi:NAD(P)H-dependent oxidoreductase [Rodentibacter haemolyticus]|uniref:NAD(P)H-dependent oxidoreductase n=1 Tax=Rodentibacter haemolyticus TaxID=2778911 RepID=A0ABX6UY59_9PAST|nr:NAD(P)H-dependent oxidoreductase [Rodentibacter haemolyticus]QPB42404.1 NAD(P)H-dependent oxidoreductase [Rodentibacter haemolyticus]